MTHLTEAQLAGMQARADAVSESLRSPVVVAVMNPRAGRKTTLHRLSTSAADVPALLSEVDALREMVDLAEQAIADGPHGGECAGWTETPGDLYDGEPHDEVMDEDECDCWKAEYDAAKEATTT